MRVGMRVAMLTGLLALGACGGGGTTGTNYSAEPPMAEIVATPSPKPSETPPPPPEEVPAPAVDDNLTAE